MKETQFFLTTHLRLVKCQQRDCGDNRDSRGGRSSKVRQSDGFLIKVKHAVGDEEWQRRLKKAEAELAELTKKVEKVEELRSAVEEAKTENLYGKLEEEKSLHSQAAPKLQELDAMEEQLRELQGAKEREVRSPVL